MKKIISILLLLTVVTTLKAQKTDCLLDKKPVKDLVQDYANILTDNQEQSLRQSLIAFNDSTSTQILVVTVKSLCGYDKASFTTTLGEQWGVGQKGKDNGIIIMVKPKEIDGRGEAFISVGYGLEGVLPDAIAKRIYLNEMSPSFKKKNYYAGITKAVKVVMDITSGAYSANKYASKTKAKNYLPLLLVIVMFIIIMMMQAGKTRKYASTNNMGFWAAWAIMGASSRNTGGSFGSFGSGGGSFGGFGGGGFGGGGAGGSW